MAGNEPFFSYSEYLRNKYGKKAYRVSVDAGFTCPHRGKNRRSGGCTFCEEYGARAVYLEGRPEGMLEDQVIRGIDFLSRRYGAELFLLYFQAFSSTFAPVDTLKRTYDSCLEAGTFQELIVSTRPDCITPEVTELLASYRRPDFDVWVELGLQSTHDRTLKRIHRGHTAKQFDQAYHLLKRSGLLVAVHIIFGLPGETVEDMMSTVDYLGSIKPEGVKIHNLHVPFETALYREYLRGELAVPCSRRHLDYTVKALERLPRNTIIMRLTCDTPEHRLAVPGRFWIKPKVYAAVRARMEALDTWQGRLYPG